MSFYFHFRGLEERADLRDLIDFISIQDLKYPNYQDWVQKTEYELDSGYKNAVLAFSEGRLVGDLIFQPHKEISRFLELKNLRIHPMMRGRKFPEFMLRNVEVENKDKYDAIIGDLPANLPGMLRFMESQGYDSIANIPLYKDTSLDIVVLKFLNKSKKDLILLNANKIILNKAV